MELEFVRWLRERAAVSGAVIRGIGDDAAIVACTGGQAVVTSDMLMDGTDFVLAECGARRAGRKSLAVNLSDLAAMAATPVAGIVSVALPRQGGRRLAEELYEGLLPLADEFELSIAGGDTNSWDGPLVVSITLLGHPHPRGSLLRQGGEAGDQLVVSGQLGGSILGHHFDFQPRIHEAYRLRDDYELHAAIDLSDGLGLDLARLAAESGCGAEIELSQIPVSAAARQLAAQSPSGRSPLDHALGDGEDFELLLAVPPSTADRLVRERPLPIPLTRIGRLTDEAGVWQIAADGQRSRLPATGYEHRFES